MLAVISIEMTKQVLMMFWRSVDGREGVSLLVLAVYSFIHS